MDIHIRNHRLFQLRRSSLSHVIIPKKLLKIYGIDILDDHCQLWTHTRFYQNSMKPSTFEKILWKKTEDGDLVTSIPVFLNNKIFHPFNMAMIKIVPSNNKPVFIPFLYITLLFAYNENLKDIITSDTDAQKVHNNILIDIYQDMTQGKINSNSITATPISMLHQILKSKHDESTEKHHLALEAVGNIRGFKTKPQETTINNSKTQPIHIKININPLGNHNKIVAQHIITSESYFICIYDIDFHKFSNVKSILDSMPCTELHKINPLKLIQDEIFFLQNAQESLIASLEENLKLNPIHQRLPITIPTSPETHTVLIDHVIEALFTLRQWVSEQAAWIQAVSTNFTGTGNQLQYWADIYPLWELGNPEFGLNLHMVSGISWSNNTFWTKLLQMSRFENLLKRGRTVWLIVCTDFTAYVVLPGGFVIKGSYKVHEEDLEAIRCRYG